MKARNISAKLLRCAAKEMPERERLVESGRVREKEMVIITSCGITELTEKLCRKAAVVYEIRRISEMFKTEESISGGGILSSVDVCRSLGEIGWECLVSSVLLPLAGDLYLYDRCLFS